MEYNNDIYNSQTHAFTECIINDYKYNVIVVMLLTPILSLQSGKSWTRIVLDAIEIG